MAPVSLNQFEFFKVLLPGMYEDALRLPNKFVQELGDRRDLKLRLDGVGMPLWDVRSSTDEESGDMYLALGWKEFVRAHDLRIGYILIFRYDGPAATLVATVFDRSTCRKQYVHAAGTSTPIHSPMSRVGDNASRRSMSIAEPSQFTVCLRQSNLETKHKQYLNMPAEFKKAHRYQWRRWVELRIRGRSWLVMLMHGKLLHRYRTSFRYGWHQFCVDNGLEVGDTYFFKVIHEGPCVDDDDSDEEMDDDKEDDEHVLQVQVRKKNGTMIT